MKSILLTSSSSDSSTSSSNKPQTSNNLSLLAEDYSVKEQSKVFKEELGDNEVILRETIFLDSKITHFKSNNKKQVLGNKKLSSSDKSNPTSDRNDYSDIECEKQWPKTTGAVSSDYYYSLNFESYPLIETNNVIVNESDNSNYCRREENLIPSAVTQVNSTSTKLINLRKKNGTTLIFQRKNSSDCSEYQELEIESLKKRQSLHWPNKSAIPNHTKLNRSRHYSWHDQHSIEEEFENSVSSMIFYKIFSLVLLPDNFLCTLPLMTQIHSMQANNNKCFKIIYNIY